MDLKVNDNDRDLFWGVYILGLMSALESGSLHPEECEVLLFNPYMKENLEKMNISEDVIMLIGKGMELDDVKRMIPNHLNESIERIKADCISYLRSHETINYPIKRYFG